MLCPLQRLAQQLAGPLRLTGAESAILARLWQAGSAWVATEYLNEVTAPYARGEQYRQHLRDVGACRVHVHNIREKLGEGVILGHVAYGHTLGADGVRLVRRTLGQAVVK